LSLTEKWELQRKEKIHRRRLENLVRKIATIKTSTNDSRRLLKLVMAQVMAEINAVKGVVVLLENAKFHIEARQGVVEENDIHMIINQLSRERIRAGEILVSPVYTILPLKTKRVEIIIAFGNPIDDEDMPFLELFLASSSELINNARLFEEKIRNEKMISIGLATRTIIHDLRVPLSAVFGSIELCLISQNLTPKLKKWITTAQIGASRVIDMIEDISDYSRGELKLQ